MRPWHRKAITDGLKSVVPFQSTLRHIKRRISPYQPDPEMDDHLVGDGWRIINILADGVSDLALKRVEYRAILQRDGFPKLIDMLKKKITLTEQG